MTKSDWLNAMRPDDRDIIRLGPDGRCDCKLGEACRLRPDCERNTAGPFMGRCTAADLQAAGFELHAPVAAEPAPQPQFDRPPREDYIGCCIERADFQIEAALEVRPGDNHDALAEKLEQIVETVADRFHDLSVTTRAQLIGDRIAMLWGRAFFVEVWGNGRRWFGQVFQPFGVPRNRP